MSTAPAVTFDFPDDVANVHPERLSMIFSQRPAGLNADTFDPAHGDATSVQLTNGADGLFWTPRWLNDRTDTYLGGSERIERTTPYCLRGEVDTFVPDSSDDKQLGRQTSGRRPNRGNASGEKWTREEMYPQRWRASGANGYSVRYPDFYGDTSQGENPTSRRNTKTTLNGVTNTMSRIEEQTVANQCADVFLKGLEEAWAKEEANKTIVHRDLEEGEVPEV
ncbi:hypothetical protein M231_03620 [Tremella mesenterica]|uniref:Uncharacterized protein n=1 Tax=Tremella mesenterica TaxID=5217 RepID=A0A4Q1BMP5_TREME|nr:hypothetical protein M231_03620 [Tremella mesenterica]